jgi:hypothetical protein
MRPLPDGKGTAVPQGRRWKHLPWSNPRRSLTIVVRYTGGPEATISVKARGSEGVFRGSEAIFDVLGEVWQWEKYRPPPSKRP